MSSHCDARRNVGAAKSSPRPHGNQQPPGRRGCRESVGVENFDAVQDGDPKKAESRHAELNMVASHGAEPGQEGADSVIGGVLSAISVLSSTTYVAYPCRVHPLMDGEVSCRVL